MKKLFSMRPLTLLFTLLFLILHTSFALAFQLRGMDNPDSFIVDPSTGVYYVSNVSGPLRIKDNNAFIAKIDPTGKLVDRDFILSGKKGVHLNAPKGLALSGNNLYVADLNGVRRFDKASGKPLGSIDLSLLGARFLNGLAVGPEGHLFVSDTTGNTIYRINPANNFQITILAKGPKLGNPKGLVYEVPHRRLLVATGSGQLIAVDMQGNILLINKKQFKGLNGIDLDREGNIIVSSARAGTIYRILKYSTVEVIKKSMVTPMNISYDFRNHRVLVPSFKGNLVFTLPLK
jgi:DNA-binding beta-propeller fold protein YncE